LLPILACEKLPREGLDMNVLITGGAGFLGSRLARALLERGTLRGRQRAQETIRQLTVVDAVRPSSEPSDSRYRSVAGDIADVDLLKRVIDRETTAIFHLAAVVSGQAEADLELGLRVNLDASRRLFDLCREMGHRPRVVFTSSVAVYGGTLPPDAGEGTAPNPQTSYGTEKAMTELLLDDYSRRGFLDGRSLRLPTISVRPGRPNAAASSFASGIIREPLNGQPAICPVDPDTRLWLLSPPTAIACLVHAHEISADELGTTRTVNLPGLSVTVRDMVSALEQAAGREAVERIRFVRDPEIARMAATWPGSLDASRALALGFPTDDDFSAIVRRYIDDELGGGRPRDEA
jgi:nucleoside-diphosphate-sugar epimerase